MASGGASRSVLGSSDEIFEFECGLCIEDEKHRQAKKFCSACKAYLCGSCMDSHSRFPALRKHKTVSIEEMKKVCGLCNADGKNKEARCFCKNCDAWICDDCTKSHKRFRDLKKHTIVSRKDMFHSDSTVPCDISVRLGQLSTKPSEEKSYSKTGSETKPCSTSKNKQTDSSTQPSDAVASSSSRTKPSIVSAAQHSNINILGYKTIKKVKEIDVKVSGDREDCDITGCCFMPGGTMILCDWNNDKIKLLDRSLSLVDSLDPPEEPWDVAAVDNSNVIVTMPWKTQLQFIQVLPSLKLGRTIDVGEMCWGVAVAAGKIFVSCYNDDDEVGDIRVYDIEGRDMRKRLGISPNGSIMFRRPPNVAASRSGDKVFVSDWFTHTVSCLTGDGKIVYQYRDDDLEGPRGLLVDDNDNVIVCGGYSNTVQAITSAGKKHKTLLSSEDGISYPLCVSFRPSDRTLVVGSGLSDKLLIYQMS